MPSPFPGMDPYLESPGLWPDVHHGLISQIQATLNARLRTRYVVRVELRGYISDEQDPGRKLFIPDVRVEKGSRSKNGRTHRAEGEVQTAEPLVAPFVFEEEVEEAFLAINHLKTGELITVIEVLSPVNKVPNSAGRQSFLAKRRSVMASDVHWVEIDLLRAGERSPPSPPLVASDYRVFISRVGDREHVRYWPLTVRQELPPVGIPLKGTDPEATLDLRAVLNTAYDNAAYDARVDYRKPPFPPLRPADARWANQLLREKGIR